MFVVGIDLGTTHCALAYAKAGGDEVSTWEIPQLVAPGERARQTLLPSFIYLPFAGEMSGLSGEDLAVGEIAKRRGGQVSGRLVASAKSWICHGGVNRRAPILPWESPDDERKLSPLDAQISLLSHLEVEWRREHPDAPLAQQSVVVTVPASFDEAARALTLEAAARAGLGEVTLIEEPQAALYDRVAGEVDLDGARLILVVDVGGGTTDLTLLSRDDDGELARIAVGGHLMLGGENMDAALAHHVARRLKKDDLDAATWAALLHESRLAKESLLSSDAPLSATITLRQRSRKLVAGAESVEVYRVEANSLLVDGFIPFVDPSDLPEEKKRAGLTKLGLPFTQEPRLPVHIARFLLAHKDSAERAGAQVVAGLPRPDRVLLNGGVFHSAILRERLSEVFAKWFDAPIAFIDVSERALDTAVARGAARFGLARLGQGQLIEGGSARSFFLELSGGNAVCALARGTEEGSEVLVRDRTFRLLTGQPARFRLFSDTRGEHQVGDLVPVAELEAGARVTAAIKRASDLVVDDEGRCAVQLGARYNENGTLGLKLETLQRPPKVFALELQLHDDESSPVEEEVDGAIDMSLPAEFSKAVRVLDGPFGPTWTPPKVPKKPAKKPNKNARRRPEKKDPVHSLREQLEEILGQRAEWSVGLCRGLVDELLARADRRGRSVMHEVVFYRLAGFCIRPGRGAPGDRARIEALLALEVKNAGDKSAWTERWIMWRRAAAGLSADEQRAFLTELSPWLRGETVKGSPRPHGPAEMVRMLSVFERLSPEEKVDIAALYDLQRKKIKSAWPLGRLFARAPLFGAAVPPAMALERASELLEEDWSKDPDAAFSLSLIAQKTGDSAVDLDDKVRKTVIKRLEKEGAKGSLVERVRSGGDALSKKDEKRLLGDTLPVGLKL